MKKVLVFGAAMLLAFPMIAGAQQGLVGDCYDCHTMHNSEQGLPVAIKDGAVSADPIENLLKLDCIACHAADPTGGTKTMTLTGGSIVPQVMHGGQSDDLAGGNFQFGAGGDTRKVHNVIDLFVQLGSVYDNNGGDTVTDANSDGIPDEFGAPPGTAPAAHYHGLSRQVFTTDIATPFDAFTCAGARGCHGTRSQVLAGDTIDHDGNAATANEFVLDQRRVGMAAISGAHHNNYDGAKDAVNYPEDETAFHDGQKVADGYRFIPGLKGYGNETNRWENNYADHNEYYGDNDGVFDGGFGDDGAGPTGGCGVCHIQGHAGGLNSRAAFNSTLRVPNNSMSGFCSSCHGNFHSAGAGADYVDNGVSGAFLRHPSDYVIPNSGEYQFYTDYDVTAPVARPTLATASSTTVIPGSDMVMCLSCHEAHGSAYDYMLRFDYAAMTAGFYADEAAAEAEGGCLACHTAKGVLPENRTR